MNCRQIKKLKLEFFDNNLPVKTKTLIQNHLQVCTKCNRLYKNESTLAESIMAIGNSYNSDSPVTSLKILNSKFYPKVTEKKLPFPLNLFKQNIFQPKPLAILGSFLIILAGLSLLMISSKKKENLILNNITCLNNQIEGDALEAWRNQTVIISVFNEEGELLKQDSSSNHDPGVDPKGGSNYEKNIHYF